VIDAHAQKPPTVSGGTGDHVSINAEAEASKPSEVNTYLTRPLETQNQDHSISPQSVAGRVDAAAPPSRSSTKHSGPTPTESDAIATNTEPSNPRVLDPTESQATTLPILASSLAKNGAAASTKEKVQSLDANDDDVESAIEAHGSSKESDPIEQDSTQPPIDPVTPSRGSESVPPKRASRTVSNPSAASEQPFRRSGRLANRRFSVAASEATLIPLSQIRSKMTSALTNSIPSTKKDNKWIHDAAEEATREKGVPKRVGKSRKKPAPSTAQHSCGSGDDTSPSVAREDGSPRMPISSQVNWATLPPSDPAQPDASSVIDELRSSSQGPTGKLPADEDKSSRSNSRGKAPVNTQKGDVVPSRGGKGRVQPLFFPGSSQIPRPRSPSPSGSESGDQTVASLLPTKTPTRSTPRNGSQFRRLTDITSSGKLFSKSAQPRLKNTPSLKVQPRFDASDNGEDDEESSSSSGDAESNSHIPKERRAGAARRKKAQGLSSLIGSRY
jgi:hypothetical protein